VHASDFTGRAIERALVRGARHPRIRMIEDQLAVDLILDSRCAARGARGATPAGAPT
jgi:aspartate oxidase